MLAMVGEAVISLLVLGGALFVLLGAIGLAKLPDFYTRLHAPTKASTLGIGGMTLGSLLYFSWRGAGLSLHELLLMLFLFLTAPLTAHMLAKSALHTTAVTAALDSNAESES